MMCQPTESRRISPTELEVIVTQRSGKRTRLIMPTNPTFRLEVSDSGVVKTTIYQCFEKGVSFSTLDNTLPQFVKFLRKLKQGTILEIKVLSFTKEKDKVANKK
ncbi:hypothetical protein ES708_23500 [subsurface metagenome]